MAPQMTHDDHVERQYATTDRLTVRVSVWRAVPGTVSSRDAVVRAVTETGPGDVLDIGCGTGDLTRAIADAVPAAHVQAVDRSAAMVAATRERGITAQVATVTALPFEDATFDVVTCAWVLYHVPDLDQALREVARVLRPGGRAVIVTNSQTHLADLFADAGVTPLLIPFTRENGAEPLRRHFTDVSATDHPALARFETRADAEAYLATLPNAGDAHLPEDGWPRDYEGLATVFVCRSE